MVWYEYAPAYVADCQSRALATPRDVSQTYDLRLLLNVCSRVMIFLPSQRTECVAHVMGD